ncbi:radical SAM protein [Desulfopila sp. IMCC35008]|uniref:radical SAM protein n=1 Tax=Desulfopila sp. IMCC35008 TaxID=2653858 RepID=UPI0013CFB01D|nr:radical SAM protein [Desulfopila sp. IMCC35008]
MDYDGQIIRPPSEAQSIILQVTVGCSHNKCTFCGAYKEKLFSIKNAATIKKDLNFAATFCARQKRIFLADGDALIVPFHRLEKLFVVIREKLPWVTRISLYASARSIRSKTEAELQRLKELGLDRVYLGLESGNDEILASVKKGETASTMIAAAEKIRTVGLFLSVTALLGLGQVILSEAHALDTSRVLNQMKPRQIGILTLMPLDNTELGQHVLQGDFILPTPEELLRELRLILYHLNCTTQIHANHASNYVPVTGRLPRDKAKLLHEIDEALHGNRKMVPEMLRSL